MNFRLTAILFALVLALVVALLVVVLLDEDKSATAADAGLMEPLAKAGVKDKDVDTVELVRTEPAEEKLKFVKVADGKWELAEPFAGKADAFAVQGLVNDLFRAKPVKYAELTDNLSLHGLDKPTVRVTLKSQGKAETVNLGLTTIGGDTAVTFVTTSSNPKWPMAVRRSDLAGLFRDTAKSKDGPAWALAKWLADYRPRKLLAADVRDPMSELQEVKVKAGGKETALTRGPGGAWTFASPAGWGEADDLGESTPQPTTAPFTGVRPLLNALTTLQATPEDYIEKPADLGQYGLKPGDPGIVTVELKGKSGPPEVLLFGKPVEAKKDQPAGMPQVYVQLQGDPAVIKVATDRVEALRATAGNPAELRNKDLINPNRRDRIDAIDLTVGTTTVKLRRVATGLEPPKWVLYGGPGDPQDARQTEVAALLGALTRPRAAREVLTAPNDAAFSDPEKKATVRVWVDGQEKPEKPPEPGKLPPEPKLKGTPVELVFGKKEADLAFVRRITEAGKSDLKLPDSALGLVTKTRLEFLDPKVKSFDTSAAQRLAFNRGAEPFEFAKVPNSNGWLFEKPDARKGKTADENKVSNLLGLLSSLFVDRVVLEQPTPDDLKRLGLDPAAPRMKVTVSLSDPADKERVYYFGTETEDKRWVHATQAGRPVVFLAAKSTVDKFLTEDLRDPTVYRVDVPTVKRLKVRGWKGLVTQEPLVLQFEKQATGWVAVPPTTQAGYQPDSAKVEALLEALATPRAAAFVDGGAKPPHGLDVAQNPDGLEFTIEPEKGPGVTLVLGAKADGGKVYAASSAVPNEVFTIDPAAIRKLLEKPASLQK